VLWVHIWDFLTPVAEVMRALDDQVRAGKVLYLGISDTPAWLIAHANTLAADRGWTRFSAVQVQYSLVERTVEREFLPMARALDLAIMAWSPLGFGVLTGMYGGGGDRDGRLTKPDAAGTGLLSDRNQRIADAVREVAAELDATPAQVALAWLMGRPGVVLPIVPARKAAQLRENLGAVDVELDAEQLARLESETAIDLGFPHDFIDQGRNTTFVLGKTLGQIQDHRADRSALPIRSAVPGRGAAERGPEQAR
jgi:aryl-alcohol dehydrogenase-like predicted oxidoreductase